MYKPPMLANKFEEGKATYPLYVEPKFDGMRLVVFVTDKNVVYFSRTGKPLQFDSYGKELIELARGSQLVFDAELMARDFQETMQQGRRQSNRDETNLVLNVFDAVPLIGWIQGVTEIYTARKLLLRSLFHTVTPNKVRIVDWIGVCEDAMDVYLWHDICVKKGFEGIMLKADAPYSWKRSNDLLKYKHRERYSATVIGFEPGEGKHEGRLGALEVYMDDKKFFVGTGFNDAQRQHIWDNQSAYLGRIVHVLGQEVTLGGAVRFPVFEGWSDET